MIVITLDKVNIIASFVNVNRADPQDFLNHQTAVKNAKFHWNKTEHRWDMLIPLWTNDTFNILKMFIKEVKIYPGVLEVIENWDNTTPSVLKYYDLHPFDYLSYSYFPPYIGKHPYEDYQKEDIERSLKQNRFIFAWEMGLGKSYATIITYEYRREFNDVDKMILLTSNIGTRNLKGELIKLDRNLKESDIEVFTNVKSFTGFKKKYGKQYKNTRLIFDMEAITDKQVLILSYGAWALICSAYDKAIKGPKKNLKVPLNNFTKGKQCYLCLDECHKIANPKTDRSKALYPYLRSFEFISMFSATPADKTEKLYYIPRILDPKLVHFLNYSDWLSKYNDIGTKFSKYAINKYGWHWPELNKLNSNMAKYTAKRTQDDCLDLPPNVIVPPCYVEPDDTLLSIYKSYINYIINKSIMEGGDTKKVKDVVTEKFTQLQTLLENPKVLLRTGADLDEGTKKLIEDYNINDNNKLEVLDDILEDRDEEGDRGIVWYVHPETGQALLERYKKYDPVIVSSDMNDDEREERKNEFKKNSKHKILIADLLILNTSLTLIEANYSVYLENSFSYEVYFQSTGRVRRIGQSKHTYIYHTFYKNTIDIFHKLAIDNKADFSTSLFDEKAWLSMDIKGLKAFFEGDESLLDFNPMGE